MAIPVQFQQFKAAGIYRVVYDKSIIEDVNAEVLRLVVGYSEKGPFNIPVYIRTKAEFKSYFGDISKKLEKRGVWFHRMALQCLDAGPILCLNLKKFTSETVGAATIDTNFAMRDTTGLSPIHVTQLPIKTIYDTSRFWQLDAEKLNGALSADKVSILDKYINISTTDTKKSSCSFFIRKASGNKVSGYGITVSDWYSNEEMPEYLEHYRGCLVSDFFAEVYVFNGQFKQEQVLASSTLKNYFVLNDDGTLELREYIYNAWNERVDTLDALYMDETSGAIGHYIGCLIPGFMDKSGVYRSLDLLFNSDNSKHKLMMAFNTELLYDDYSKCSINLGGQDQLSTIDLSYLYGGSFRSTLFSNKSALCISDIVKFKNDFVAQKTDPVVNGGVTDIKGSFVISDHYASGDASYIKLTSIEDGTSQIKVNLSEQRVKNIVNTYPGAVVADTNSISNEYNDESKTFGKFTTYITSVKELSTAADGSYNFTDYSSITGTDVNIYSESLTCAYNSGSASSNNYGLYGSSLTFIQTTYRQSDDVITFPDSFAGVDTLALDKLSSCWYLVTKNKALYNYLHPGDLLLAEDNTVDYDVETEEHEDDPDNYMDNVFVTTTNEFVKEDGTTYYNIFFSGKPYMYNPTTYYINKDKNSYFNSEEKIAQLTSDISEVLSAYDKQDDLSYMSFAEIVSVADKLAQNDDTGSFCETLNGSEVYTEWKSNKTSTYIVEGNANGAESHWYLIRINGSLNREIGKMSPTFLKGYEYLSGTPKSNSVQSKLEWQKVILSVLTDERGLRTGLLNKSDIDYRYMIDTFESYIQSNLKNQISAICKEKQSAFAILNFPAVKTFMTCPYASFTDDGVFNVQHVVEGYNRTQSTSSKFSMPSELDGASFCAFYTPVKMQDGYQTIVVPSAALVSNLFMEKYLSRKPYYIVAGPNFANITNINSTVVGPDYNYSMDELQIIEPYGVNCMVYRPGFGTFINANQTAKQTPKSALSSVNVRELVIYVQDEVEKVLQQYQWEFNNQTTRNAILSKVNYICNNVMANGGIVAFKAIMDGTNNTPEIIDNEMAVLSLHIEPGRGCGKMIQELTLYRTGGLSSMISD